MYKTIEEAFTKYKEVLRQHLTWALDHYAHLRDDRVNYCRLETTETDLVIMSECLGIDSEELEKIIQSFDLKISADNEVVKSLFKTMKDFEKRPRKQGIKYV